MLLAAWILLCLGALEVVGRPFMFGKKVELTASGWLASLIIFVLLCLPVCGKVIGWW